jgi:phosphoglycerate kinase
MKFLKNLSKQKIFGKTCLLRVDLNLSEEEAKNSHRISGVLPTIKFLTGNGAKIIILSHRGRPEKFDKKLSLKPFVDILSKKLTQKVNFINHFGFLRARDKVGDSRPGSIFLLENLRFLPGEYKNDPKLAKRLANLGDFFVNDAFAESHRRAASVAAITKFIPSYAGFLLEKEIKNLNKAGKPKKPFVFILGGAKISDKIGLIENFLKKTKSHSERSFAAEADCFLIGGGMANTFFAAQGLPIGESLYEKHMVLAARNLIKQAEGKFILPNDAVIEGGKILDIGGETAEKYDEVIKKAGTIIWNGPMGYFENPKFAKGSEAIAKAVINNKKAFAVVGGGETSAIFQMAKIKNQLRRRRVGAPTKTSENPKSNLFISTGGGAMLAYLAGEKLPGIEALY